MGATRRISSDGVSLHVTDEGSGTPVLLLHGFPDSGRLWRHQIPVLVEAGFRAVVPDLRGFGESSKPPSTSAYRMSNVVRDCARLLDALRIERAHVVGHDWGAIAAWAFAGQRPERVHRLAALSVGHPRALVKASLNPNQSVRLWYANFFQLPVLPERVIRREDWRFLRKLLSSSPDVDAYVRDLSRPHALRAALNWYRANGKPHQLLRAATYPEVKVPTLGIWSPEDWALLEQQMTDSHRYVASTWRYEKLGGGHWIPLSAPEALSGVLVEFLTGGASAGTGHTAEK